jgi:hypothetical protein
LRAIGAHFEVDAFLADADFVAEATFHQGEPRLAGVPGDAPHVASGFSVRVSAANANDLPGQVRDALVFLNEHEDELRRLGSFAGLEEVFLEFAISRREGPVQTAIFPAELLWRAGALDIDLVVSHYAMLEGES